MLKEITGRFWRKLTPSTIQKIIRSTQEKFTVSAAVIILNEKTEVLLLDHVLRSHSGWGFPGGFVGRSEQPDEAVRREIREETGLELEDLKLLRLRTIDRHIEILFTAKPVGTAAVKSREIKSLGWFAVGEMPEKMSEAQKSIVRKVLNLE